MGYLLLALVTLDRASLTPVLVYLLAYVLMNAGAFAVVSMLYSRPGRAAPDLRPRRLGLPLSRCSAAASPSACCRWAASRRPSASSASTWSSSKRWATATSASPSSACWRASIGVFYYLRVVYYLYMKPETRQPEGLLIDVWGRAAAVLAALGTLALGIWPTGLLQWLIAGDRRRSDDDTEEVSPLTLNRLSFYLRCLRHLQELGDQPGLLAGDGAALPPLRHPDPQGPRPVRRVRHPRRRLRRRRPGRPPELPPRPRPPARAGDRRHGEPGERARPVPRLQLRRLPAWWRAWTTIRRRSAGGSASLTVRSSADLKADRPRLRSRDRRPRRPRRRRPGELRGARRRRRQGGPQLRPRPRQAPRRTCR